MGKHQITEAIPGIPLRGSVQRWSTDDVPEAHRVDYYADTLASAVVPLAIMRRGDGPFEATLVSGTCGPIGMIAATGSPLVFVRGPSELRRTTEHGFRLILNRATAWDLDQRGASRLECGDAAFLDSRYGHRTELHPGFDTLQLKLPDSWLRQWIPDPGLFSGRVFRNRTGGWAGALTAYMRMLTPEFLATAPLPAGMIADHLGTLLALVASDLTGSARAQGPVVASLVERIQRQIRERCTERELTAADVASDLNVSLRTLHRAMTANQLSFGACLLGCRADVGIRMLTSALFKRLTVAEIARRCGFADASHFARVVSHRTGRTPRQLRALAAE